MGRPKGGKNKYWSKEEKISIVKNKVKDTENNTISNRELCKG